MTLKIAVPKEDPKMESRVAASPETVRKLTALGCAVTVESGAGAQAFFTDDMFKNAGATIAKTAETACKDAAIVLRVRPSSAADLAHNKKGALLICLMDPHGQPDLYTACAKAGIDAFSMELVPRISRAQAMDVLSSQSNLAGYKAVLDAASEFTHAFPMMMTAAGSIPPAKVFVMGAGVAGLQAIATARRLGAAVTATDVRPAAKEQVESLGASFVAVEDDEFKQAETAGGYAKEMSKDYQKKQAALVESHIAKQDIVITTALIPGRPAPKLISEAMVKSMKPGSLIVDLAVEAGGNCALSKPGETVETPGGVKIIGHKNVPGRLAADASALYAKNLLNLLNLLIDRESGKLAIDWDDDIVKGIALTREGAIIHPQFKDAPAKTPPKAPAKTSTKTPAKAPAKKAAAPKKTQTADKTEGKEG
ncbi:MAG: Re/Si-specific NAD(P)(+) transhydrogenase subunit alpha [Alphaproteobacteria bacterium]